MTSCLTLDEGDWKRSVSGSQRSRTHSTASSAPTRPLLPTFKKKDDVRAHCQGGFAKTNCTPQPFNQYSHPGPKAATVHSPSRFSKYKNPPRSGWPPSSLCSTTSNAFMPSFETPGRLTTTRAFVDRVEGELRGNGRWFRFWRESSSSRESQET